jgi:WD40 repeat protein
VAYSPDGRRLAAPRYWRLGVTLWDAVTGRVDRTLARPGVSGGGANRLAFAADGRRLADTAGVEVWVWDVRSGRQIGGYSAPNHGVLVFHPGGRRLFNASCGRADLLEVQTSQPVLRLAELGCRAAAFSPDGHRLAVSDGQSVRVYDATPRGKASRGPTWTARQGRSRSPRTTRRWSGPPSSSPCWPRRCWGCWPWWRSGGW